MPKILGDLLTADVLKRPSVWPLLAANALPLLGVLLFGWSTFEIVLLYWLENVVIGVVNVLKIITCSPDPGLVGEVKNPQMRNAMRDTFGEPAAGQWTAAKLFFVPFFTMHYGIFCLVHGVFVFVLLGPGGLADSGFGNAGPRFFGLGAAGATVLSGWLLLAFAALASSHLYSFFTNYLGRGEYRRTTPPDLMAQPYGRVVALHMAIVLGAFATVLLGSPIVLLVILVAGKTLLDLKLHLREHAKAESPLAEPDPNA
ncbi:DUF6498-containing protein [Pseudobythopirellula maris]|nr:DUF6498-containing protein [Pseudobythopirellula maris]